MLFRSIPELWASAEKLFDAHIIRSLTAATQTRMNVTVSHNLSFLSDVSE